MKDDGQVRKQATITFERHLPGPRERVWEFLTDSQHIADWFGGGPMKYEIEPRRGGSVSLADDHIRGVVTQWNPPSRLIYTWNVFSPGDFESPFPESYVKFELQSDGEQVLLTLTHLPVLEEYEGRTMMGWHTFLARLEALVRGETPESRAVLMERHRIHYGVPEMGSR